MTFTEAAIEVLRREGKPLHFKKIAEIAIREGLLDHVGKIPEEIMGGQLAAHCRLPHTDRRVLAVQPATFALVEWGLDEDPVALENMLERPPENEPPLRSNERHPIPSREVARGVARVRRREEGEERHGRRFPPPAEVTYEILAGMGRPMALSELGAQGAERLLMPEAFVRDTSSLAAALLEDNRRREASGRRALFGLEGDTVSLVAQPEPGERAAPAAARVSAPTDVRRMALAALRRRIRDCNGATVEYLVARLLEKQGLRDLKVAKRGREQVVYTGRKKIGLGDVRHCVRIVRGDADVGRRDVQEVRRDLEHYGAQIGILVTAGDAMREARAESLASGQLPVFLLCGEPLAEAFTEVSLGCQVVMVPVVDEPFFNQAVEAADKEDAARRARREERHGREREGGRENGRERERENGRERERPKAVLASPPGEASAELSAASSATPFSSSPAEPANGNAPVAAIELSDDEDGEEETEKGASPGEAAQSTPAEGERRRKRRRRRRGGRGRGRERAAGGAGSQPPSGGAAEGGSAPEATPSEGPQAGSPSPAIPLPDSGEGSIG